GTAYRLGEPQDRLRLSRRIELADTQKKIVRAEIATDESSEHQERAGNVQQTRNENLWPPVYLSDVALNWPEFTGHRRNHRPSQPQNCNGEKKSGERT